MESEDKKEEQKAFQIRLPLPVYDRLEEIANTNRRSLNSEIIIILEAYYKLLDTMPGTLEKAASINQMYDKLKESNDTVEDRISELNELIEKLKPTVNQKLKKTATG